jgi:hypothetical protein
MFTRSFWASAIERAVKSFAQALVAILGVEGVTPFNAPWHTALTTAGMAALLSVLTSLGSERVGNRNDPSLVPSMTSTPNPETPAAARLQAA